MKRAGSQFQPVLFNAMAFPDVKSFCSILYDKLYFIKHKKDNKTKLDRSYDEIELAEKLERILK